MNQSDFHHLLTRYQRGECTPAEVRLLEQWYDLLGHDQPPLNLTAAEREGLRTGLWQRIADRTLAAEDLSPPAGAALVRRPGPLGGGRRGGRRAGAGLALLACPAGSSGRASAHRPPGFQLADLREYYGRYPHRAAH